MAAEDRRESPALNQVLARTPHRFSFFQAVRLLEHRQRERERERAKAKQGRSPGGRLYPVGHDHPLREVVFFRAQPSMTFPAVDVSQFRDAGPAEDDVPELVVTFLGLTGPNGVLPRHYTELLIRRIRDRDVTLRDFLDIFNHRLISLFHRAWEKYRLPLGYERACLDDPDGEPDLASRAIFSLVGLGTPGLRGRLEVDDALFLHYSGHYAHAPRTASALRGLLEDHLGVPTAVLQNQGQWLSLAPEDQTRMPTARSPRGRNNELGISVVVGQRVWDIQSKFRLRLGPLRWNEFRALMPNGPALRPLCQVTRLFVGPEYDFDVQPVLRPEDVPECRLDPRSDVGPHLGWNTWLRSRPFLQPVDDAVFVENSGGPR